MSKEDFSDGLTEDQFEKLTPEDQQRLLAGEDAPPADEGSPPQGEGENTDPEAGDASTPPENAAVKEEGSTPEQPPAATDENKDGQQTESEPDPEPESTKTDERVATEPFVPVYKEKSVEGLDKRAAEIQTAKQELLDKMMEGDITQQDYSQQVMALDAENNKILTEKIKSEVAAEQNQQIQAQRWEYEVQSFLQNPNRTGGRDYLEDPILLGMLDSTVKTLAGMEENQDKPHSWFLDEAQRQIDARFSTASQAKQAVAKAAQPTRAPDLTKVPPSLSTVPSAGSDNAGANPLAKMAELDGEDYERAFERLSPEDQERLLQS